MLEYAYQMEIEAKVKQELMELKEKSNPHYKLAKDLRDNY